MARRIHLDVDILEHINDLKFKVFRSETPEVDQTSKHIMDLNQSQTVKVDKMQMSEILERNPDTPYAFYVRRHYNTDTVFPVVRIGTSPVLPTYLFTLPSIKEIEIHSGDAGLYDGRPIYMDYEYTTQPVVDDDDIESGKVYYGPPALGLSDVSLLEMLQDFIAHKFKMEWDYIMKVRDFYYRIYAEDTSGQLSPWSDIQHEQIVEDDVYFRLQSSEDRETWREEAYIQTMNWYVDYFAIDDPTNIQECRITPLSSKRTEIRFENPWKFFKRYKRLTGYFRVRAEDSKGHHTAWYEIGPLEAFFEPKKLIIRRKQHNGTVSSKDKVDAITVFELEMADINPADDEIILIDDQLTDKTIYAYTFFYEDELSKEAVPFFEISDHMKWTNIVLSETEIESDDIPSDDFYMSFALSDKVIDIGVGTT